MEDGYLECQRGTGLNIDTEIGKSDAQALAPSTSEGVRIETQQICAGCAAGWVALPRGARLKQADIAISMQLRETTHPVGRARKSVLILNAMLNLHGPALMCYF